MTAHPYDLVIGLDRSDKKADLCLLDPRNGQRRSAVIDTSPEALWEWLLELRQQHPGACVGLCLEQPAVHLIPFLEAYDWITLHPINPITLQKYREAFVTSRAKDDTKDAEYLADLLLTHPAQLPAWAPEDSATRAVQQLVFHRRALVDERTGLSNRLDSAASLQRYTGVAPVTKKSGGSCRIHRRYLCPKFHRQSFHEYAGESILWSRWAAAYYLQQRTKGSPHHTAVRALAFKWQRVIWRCWQDRTEYREHIYEAALRKSGSPLVGLLDGIELGKSPVKKPVKKS